MCFEFEAVNKLYDDFQLYLWFLAQGYDAII